MYLNDLWLVGDVLFVEVNTCLSLKFYLFLILSISVKKKTHNLSLPTWAETIYQKIMDNVRWGFYFDYRVPEMAKLQIGLKKRVLSFFIDKRIQFK